MTPGLYVYVAVAVGAAAIGGTAAYKVQGWRYGEQIASMKADAATAVTAAVNGARVQEQARFTKVQEVTNAATKRATAARADADSARSTGDRLRDDNAAALRASRESLAACGQYAAAVSGLFDNCSGDFGAMAERAQGHANDVKLLLESWPK